MPRAFSLYLDAVRLFAAILVLVFHGNQIFKPGWVLTSLGHEAVVVFFVLSGFVIAYVADSREHDFRSFMVARAARIYSVAIPAIVLTVALDFAGYHIARDIYPPGYQAWESPLLRLVASTLFLNELWTQGIQLGSNVPYWSLNYEVWYYVLFGIALFFRGVARWGTLLALCLFLGPKILLLLPIWWLGVWVYRSRTLKHLPRSAAWLSLLLSLLGMWFYVHAELAAWGVEFVQELVGADAQKQLSFSGQFVSDYYLGAVLALHFVGMRILMADVGNIPRAIEAPVRYLAGATFSIYLFHQPLLWFYSTVFAPMVEGLERYLLVVPLTALTAIVLAVFTEHRKTAWKRAAQCGWDFAAGQVRRFGRAPQASSR